MMLAGFRSRCVMPFACAAAMASASGMAIGEQPIRRQARQAGSGRSSGWPSTSSIVMNRMPSASSDGVDRDDVGMVQRRHGARFRSKRREPLGVGAKSRGQDLDGDVAAEARIARSIHLAHAAGAEQRDDFVCAEARASGERHESR